MVQAENLTLKANRREQVGTRVARKERASGRIPAIIYGHKQDPVAVSLDYHDLALELQHRHRLVDVELDGQATKFLIKDVQFDHLGDRIVHVDLTRVDLDERVTVSVAIEFRGVPVGAIDGGVIDQLESDIELECVVTHIPESIRVSVAELQVGDLLQAKDLELPDGATLVTDAETAIVALRAPTEEVEEEEVAGEEGESSDEPEVITAREKTEEEGES